MKIFIINPNSDPTMTQKIQDTANRYASSDSDVIYKPTPGAPKFVETYENGSASAPGMIALVRENEADFDGFIIACHADIHLDVMKEITDKPVVGIGEAYMKIASMLGHRFSVLSDNDHSIPNKEALVRKYHLENGLASVRAPDKDWMDLEDRDKYIKAGTAAIKEDKAEVLVLGCAGMTGLDKDLQEALHIPVLDGIVCALMIAEGLIRYGVSTSKMRRYNPDYAQ
jgi:allantoin racemase